MSFLPRPSRPLVRALPCVAVAILGLACADATQESTRGPGADATRGARPGATGTGHAAPATVVDDHGDTLAIGARATRIVSLNPATTEALFALGAGDRVVGRTHWDAWPDAARAVPDLGDGMRPNVERVLGARPDLVVLYASESNRAAAAALRRAGVRVIALRTDRLAHFAPTVSRLALAIGDSARGRAVIDSVTATLAAVRALPRPDRPPRVFWPLWLEPPMAVGRGSFLHDLLEAVGAVNVFGELEAPSPQVAFEAVLARDPEVVVAGPRMAGRLRADPRWRTLRAVREGRVVSPDSVLVGRPGVRVGEAATHLRRLLIDSLPPSAAARP